MFIESSAPRVPGDKARLFSEVFQPTSTTKCFNFYYNMNGADIGTLNVYILVNQSTDTFSTEALVWSLQGNMGDQWSMGQFNITSRYSSKPYQIVFEGVRGKGYRGDIAIDDTALTDGGCQQFPSTSMPAQSPTTSPNCHFETGLCIWQQSVTDQFNWTVSSGATTSFGTGPVGDHTPQMNGMCTITLYPYHIYWAIRQGFPSLE